MRSERKSTILRYLSPDNYREGCNAHLITMGR
jgi:hypothetical protein